MSKSGDRPETITVYVENIPKEMQAMKEMVSHEKNISDHVRSAIQFYVEIQDVLDDYEVDYDDDELRHLIGLWVRQGVKKDVGNDE